MNDLLPGIRNAVRALIVREHQVLLLRKGGDGRGERFALPGGAQEPGETLTGALQRECLEEIGTTVSIQQLLLVADFIKQRNSAPPSRRQLVEILFRCRVPEDYQPCNGPRPDKHQLGVTWIDRSALRDLTLTPGFLASHLAVDIDSPASYAGAFADHADSQEHR